MVDTDAITFELLTSTVADVRDAGRWEPVVNLESAILPDFAVGPDGDIVMAWVPAGTVPSHPARTGMSIANWMHNIEALGDLCAGLPEL